MSKKPRRSKKTVEILVTNPSYRFIRDLTNDTVAGNAENLQHLGGAGDTVGAELVRDRHGERRVKLVVGLNSAQGKEVHGELPDEGRVGVKLAHVEEISPNEYKVMVRLP